MALVKQIEFGYNEKGVPKSSGRNSEVISDPFPNQRTEGKDCSLPEKVEEVKNLPTVCYDYICLVHKGPEVNPGDDYSRDRKNDYKAKRN